jgi:HD-GYP domain-containing protein (c-di-GMP phosphodiesterase class II)
MHPIIFKQKEAILLAHLCQPHVPEDVRKHHIEVAEFGIVIAELAGLSSKEKDGMYFAGLGHDNAKVRSDYLKLLNGDIEFESTEAQDARYNHPVKGAEFLAKHRFPFLSIQIVLEHHERYDGGGYPNGLTGCQINPRSKLFGLVDYLSSLKYRGPKDSPGISDIEQRADIMRGEFGTCLDPEYRPVFEELVDHLVANPELRL